MTNFFAQTLTGATIDSVLVDSEVVYIMLTNGTQITIRGVVLVQPGQQNAPSSLRAASSLQVSPQWRQRNVSVKTPVGGAAAGATASIGRTEEHDPCHRPSEYD